MTEHDIRETLSEIESELNSGVATADLLNEAGVGYFLLGEMESSLEYLLKAVGKKETAGILFNLANTYSELFRPNEAIDTFLRVLEKDPVHIGALNNLADEYEKIGDLDKAHEMFHYLTHLQPDKALSHFNLGNFFLRQNQHIEATRCYNKALENDPEFADVYHNIAWILFRSKAYKEALRYVSEGLNADNDNSDLHDLKRKIIQAQEDTAG